jgi:hypothetical protein
MALATAARLPAPASSFVPTQLPTRRTSSGTAPPAFTTSQGPVHTLQMPASGEARRYVTRDGKTIELPAGMTVAEAAKLEADASSAAAKLGKGPPPKPVPDVKKLIKKPEKKEPAKAGGKGEKKKLPGKPGAKGGAAALAALKAIGTSKVAQYLAAKATPVLAKGLGALQKLRQNQQTHEDAATKRAQAEQAVVIPASEGQAKSNTGQVNEVGARPAPPIDENKGKQQLQESLKENVPQSVEDVDNFKRDQKAQHMGADVMKVVLQDKTAVVSTFETMEQTPPPAPREHEPEALPAPEAAPPTGALNLAKGAIAPLQKEHTDVSNFTNEADNKLKEEGVTQEQLDMVDSGDLAVANKEKKGMEATAKTEPLAVQKFAQQQGDSVAKELKEKSDETSKEMTAKRKGGLEATNAKQKKTKTDLEKKREEVAAKINGIYTTAQDNVKKRLADLETQSMKRFEDGNARATKEFEENVNREIEAFKDERYSGWFGWARKAKDWLLGMDDLPEVKAIFDRNRAKFVATIDALVAEIAAENKRVVQECKDELQKARSQIKEYVDKLGPALRETGQSAAAEMNAKLNDLDKFVANKEEALQTQLKDKQTAAIKAIDDKIEKMKEAMSGALSKLGKLLLAAAKKFFTWALEKFGVSLSTIEGIINKGAAVLKAIFTQPIKFVKNLMNAAITGFKNFGNNFLKHLKDALFEWLTGSLEGLKLPSTWDLKGVIGVALQMIGISYDNLRKHMVAVMGESVVKGMEKGFELVQTLVRDGPMAAWEQLKEMAGEMSDAFVDTVKDFIKQKIIEQAIQWLVSLFIPGAGLIKAAIGIYDTIVFFIQKAKQIIQMVSDFLGSIGEIAAGNIASAADAMEKGLARGLSLVISFLAQLLHLSGITNKIKAAIAKIRGKVDAVLLKVVKWIATQAKKLWGGMKSAAGKLVEWWKSRFKLRGSDGKPHELFFSGEEGNAVPMVASNAQDVKAFLKQVGSRPEGKKKPGSDHIATVTGLLKTIETEEKKPKEKRDDAAIAKAFTAMVKPLESLLGTGEIATKENPLDIKYPKPQWDTYPHVHIGPYAEKRVPQSVLAKKDAEAVRPYVTTKEFAAWDGKVKTYKPAAKAQSLPNGNSHPGIAEQYRTRQGLVIKLYPGSTTGGKLINDLFRPFGYRGKEEDASESRDGDHLVEMQLGGPNKLENLWPLEASINRSGGSTTAAMKVGLPGGGTIEMKELKERSKVVPTYLKLESTL